MSKSFIFLLLISSLLNKAQQQFLTVPDIACPQYFQYGQDGSGTYGLLTMPYVSQRMQLEVHLSQKTPLTQNYYGKISLAEDRFTTERKIKNGEPILYRVDFPTTESPKLTRIVINNQDICFDNEYSRPSTSLFLQHSLVSSTHTFPIAIDQPTPDVDFPWPTPPVSRPRPKPEIETTRPAQPVSRPRPRPEEESTRPAQPVSRPRPRPSTSTSPRTSASENDQCGKVSGVTTFIYGGLDISRGQHPWLTAIYAKSAGLRFLCGGSLVSRKTVLSAAHCFTISAVTADRLVVNVGRYNLEDYSETNFQTREIQNLVIHPDFAGNVHPDADLAILQLQRPVEFNAYVRPICLWSEPVDTNRIVGMTGVIAGWGGDENGNAYTAIPKMVDANIVSEGECLRSSQVYASLTSRRTICAGNRDGTGPCMGDSGSGLLLNRNDRWYLRGVVSIGTTKQKKCDLLEYVVFCDVAQHLSWIEENTI
uniref:Peptidase S1 domain-containing protein n=1 Tax=Stomoxys calcitrans TaxID=35570 RepID=A0A1I8Q9S0_STOCA